MTNAGGWLKSNSAYVPKHLMCDHRIPCVRYHTARLILIQPRPGYADKRTGVQNVYFPYV